MDNYIVVDVGNTRISCAVFIDDQLADLTHHLHSNSSAAAKDIVHLVRELDSPTIALCSVVPSVARTMSAVFSEAEVRFNQITADNQSTVSGVYSTMGADRIANMAAAAKLYAGEHAALVLDFGTATTLTAVDGTGKFLGGFITLGLVATLASLHNQTAQLPDLSCMAFESDAMPLAFSTDEAIRAGTLLSHIGAVEHWVKTARQQLDTKSTVVATGGLSRLMSSYTKIFDHVDPNLTLFGIKFIAEAVKDRADQV